MKLDANSIRIEVEAEAQVYPGTVLHVDPSEFWHIRKGKLEEGNVILRENSITGLLHISLRDWDANRDIIISHGHTILEEHQDEGYFLVMQEGGNDSNSVSLQLLYEELIDGFLVLMPNQREQFTISLRNSGNGPMLIKRISVEGIWLGPEMIEQIQGAIE